MTKMLFMNFHKDRGWHVRCHSGYSFNNV